MLVSLASLLHVSAMRLVLKVCLYYINAPLNNTIMAKVTSPLSGSSSKSYWKEEDSRAFPAIPQMFLWFLAAINSLQVRLQSSSGPQLYREH